MLAMDSFKNGSALVLLGIMTKDVPDAMLTQNHGSITAPFNVDNFALKC